MVTKKSVESKRLIQKYSRDFFGTLPDKDCIKLIEGISKVAITNINRTEIRVFRVIDEIYNYAVLG